MLGIRGDFAGFHFFHFLGFFRFCCLLGFLFFHRFLLLLDGNFNIKVKHAFRVYGRDTVEIIGEYVH